MATFAVDTLAAGTATTVSAPLNFVRNIQFAQPPSMPQMSTGEALRMLLREAGAKPSTSEQLRFVVRRLNVGWGTLRVAGGMALTAAIFNRFVASSQTKSNEIEKSRLRT